MGSSRVGSNPTRSVRLFSNSITFLEKVCIVGESNPGLPRGRREFYHWTNNARHRPVLKFDAIFRSCLILAKLACIVGESNPGLPRGRREFYHWTNNAEAINNHPSIGYHYPRFQWAMLEMCKMTTMGIEPTIFRFEVGRLIHWATRPMVHSKHLAIKYSILENITSPWHQKYLVSCMSIFSLNLAFLPVTRS